MKKGTILLAIIFALILGPKAFAEETVWDMPQSDQYGKKFGGMLGRGLLNAATCFVDLIVQTVNGTKAGPPVVGTLTGLGGGIACTALRATSGVLDIATSWVPGFNGIPVSRSYSNCLEEYQPAATETAAPPVSTYNPPSTVVQPPAEQPRKERNVMEYVKK